ncbi:ureidoglycolate lyase [Baaleninema simplex]|uniref:ureidoglycolate lyase n=1 Tax=Baaleninema simplex TaxID=2862350 RepID=UPI00316AC0A4
MLRSKFDRSDRNGSGARCKMSQTTTLQPLTAQPLTPENFRPYGQAIFASEDGKPFDETDARLDLARGTPRFYIMRLRDRGLRFDRITRHVRCTQCLGSLGGKSWAIAVAPPSADDRPDRDRLAAFLVPGNCFIKLEAGTWHAGPYFEAEAMEFYNLELSDTNVTDHFTYNFRDRDGLEFEIVMDASE